jgi:hypothetical protein
VTEGNDEATLAPIPFLSSEGQGRRGCTRTGLEGTGDTRVARRPQRRGGRALGDQCGFGMGTLRIRVRRWRSRAGIRGTDATRSYARSAGAPPICTVFRCRQGRESDRAGTDRTVPRRRPTACEPASPGGEVPGGRRRARARFGRKNAGDLDGLVDGAGAATDEGSRIRDSRSRLRGSGVDGEAGQARRGFPAEVSHRRRELLGRRRDVGWRSGARKRHLDDDLALVRGIDALLPWRRLSAAIRTALKQIGDN